MDDMTNAVHDERITMREFLRSAAEVFEQVRQGRSFAITRYGEVVGRITPPDPVDEALARAVAEGILDPTAIQTLAPASQDVGIPREPSPPGSRLGSDAITALREEERT